MTVFKPNSKLLAFVCPESREDEQMAEINELLRLAAKEERLRATNNRSE